MAIIMSSSYFQRLIKSSQSYNTCIALQLCMTCVYIVCLAGHYDVFLFMMAPRQWFSAFLGLGKVVVSWRISMIQVRQKPTSVYYSEQVGGMQLSIMALTLFIFPDLVVIAK